MRILPGILLPLIVFAGASSTAPELRKLYGEPDVEQFVVQPGVTLSVEYGEDGRACQMVIEPRRPLISGEQPATSIRLGVADAALNEVVPVEDRGKTVGRIRDFTCGAGRQKESYENVSITTDYESCEQPVMVKSVEIEYARPACMNMISEHYATPLDRYKLRGYVNDFASMIDAKWVPEIEAQCQDIEKKTNAQVFVATVPSLGGRTLESFSLALANGWSIGHKEDNRGVLIFLARDEREIRIEVGTGLESVLTNEKAAAIIQQMRPLLRDGNSGEAVLLATRRIADVFRTGLK